VTLEDTMLRQAAMGLVTSAKQILPRVALGVHAMR
jgi:hypothetical protein